MSWVVTVAPTFPVCTALAPAGLSSFVLTNSATIAANVPATIASMAAQESFGATVSASQALPLAAVAAQETFGAAVAASIPVDSASLVATETFGTTVTVTCTVPVAALACTETIGGSIAVTTSTPSASISGTETFGTNIAATLPVLSAAVIAYSSTPPITANLLQDLNASLPSSLTLVAPLVLNNGLGSPPVVNCTGTPAAAQASQAAPYVEIDITTGGIAPVAQFQWKLNGVVQQTAQTVASSFVLGTTGLTVQFSVGANIYSTSTIYTISTRASAWADKSGAANNWAQASSTKQPIYAMADAGLNGLPSVGVGTGLSILGSTTIAQPNTTFVLGWCGITSGGDIFDGNTTRQAFGMDPTALYFYAGTIVHFGATRNASMHAFAAVFNGSSSAGYLDASGSPVSGNPGANSCVAPSVAGGFPSSSGGVNRVLMYSGTMTQSQVAQIFAYFAEISGGAFS